MILLGWVEPDQFPAGVFKIAFMLRRDGEFMALEELDYMAVYLNSIVSHMKCYMDWYLKIIGLAPSGIERLISCGLQRFSITLHHIV